MPDIVQLLLHVTLFWLTLWFAIFRVEALFRRGPMLENYDVRTIRPSHYSLIGLALITTLLALQSLFSAIVIYFLLGLILLKFYSQNSTPRIICILIIAGSVSFSNFYFLNTLTNTSY